MPRPANGYTNAAGQKIPGVHDVTGRYKDTKGLMHWIHQEGLKGNVNPYASAADIGTAVHKMCELDLKGAPTREIEAVPHQMLSIPDDIDKAWQSFRAFQEWRREHHVQAIAFEESLVSETVQYGGTLDVIAFVDGVRSLIDFKTCKDASRVFLEQRIVMAAHGNLWREKHPDLPIHAFHLINLPKDGSRPGHHSFADLSPEWEMFTLQLDCWRIEKGLIRKRSVKPSPRAEALADLATRLEAMAAEKPTAAATSVPSVVSSVAAKPKPEKAPAKPKTAAKPRGRKSKVAPVEAPPPVIVSPPLQPPPLRTFQSMAELLRSYGHVREAA
jgi:hypothetical protein